MCMVYYFRLTILKLSVNKVDLSVLLAEIRRVIFFHLVNECSRRNKKFKQELQLTWFSRCLKELCLATIFT